MIHDFDCVTLFAAKDDWGKIIVPLLFAAVWIIGAVSKWLGEQQQQQQKQQARGNAGGQQRPQQVATQEELDDFIRSYSSPSKPSQTTQTQPKRKERRVRQQKPVVSTPPTQRDTVESRHLQSQLEHRHTEVVHSRLVEAHIDSGIGDDLTQRAATVAQSGKRRSTPPNIQVTRLLDRKNIGPALILGQVLQAPPGMGRTVFDPLAPPPGSR